MSSYYEYLFGVNKKDEAPTENGGSLQNSTVGNASDAIAMDEGIGEWTHKFVVYCKDPKKEFEEELKNKEGVVAVFVKEKSAPTPEETNPPNNK